jgi:hypothetical protein
MSKLNTREQPIFVNKYVHEIHFVNKTKHHDTKRSK